MVRQRSHETAFVKRDTFKASVAKSGKAVEAFFRNLRPFILPAHRRAFNALVARGLSQRRPGEQMVCCDFENPKIGAVGGRYYFSIVRDLIDAGFFPVFTSRRGTLSSFGTSRMKSLLLAERLGVVSSQEELTEQFLLITDRDVAASPAVEKMVRVNYEQRLCNSSHELALPVFVHPRLTTCIKLPYAYPVNARRPVRIFFGGNTEERKYDKNILREVYGVLTRREMLDAVRSEMSVSAVHRPTNALDRDTAQQNTRRPLARCVGQGGLFSGVPGRGHAVMP
jgi:hypothetical protein